MLQLNFFDHSLCPNSSYSSKSLSSLLTSVESIKWHRASSSVSLFQDRLFLSYTLTPISWWARLRLIKSRCLEITSILLLSNPSPLKLARSLACSSRNQWMRFLPTAATRTCSYRLFKLRTLSFSKSQQQLSRPSLLLLNEGIYFVLVMNQRHLNHDLDIAIRFAANRLVPNVRLVDFSSKSSNSHKQVELDYAAP